MVKHAARNAEPILTAEERVDRALQKIARNRSFNEEQQKWLALIREHLVKNLTIEEDDFDVVPIFEQFGGKGKARRVFG
jgi:type I restriction enzyme, R subunit